MQNKLDDIGGAKELAFHRLSVAKADLGSAERNLTQNDLRTANNRAYYAIYHAICACMATQFKAYKSHNQTLGAFNKDYVHKGIFPKDIGRRISKCQEVRHESDYNDFFMVSREETENQVATSREFIDLVERYLNEYYEE